MTVTVVEVEGWNLVGLGGVKIALSVCDPGMVQQRIPTIRQVLNTW